MQLLPNLQKDIFGLFCYAKLHAMSPAVCRGREILVKKLTAPVIVWAQEFRKSIYSAGVNVTAKLFLRDVQYHTL